MRYRTIVADPPWDYSGGFWTASHNAESGAMWDAKRVALPYESMAVDRLGGLPVPDLSMPDAFLFLWTTNRYLPDAFGVMGDWGFKYAQALVWSKDRSHCIPAAIAPVHAEFLLFGKRGKPTRRGTFPSSVIQANRTKRHSAKPECFLDHIEAACPGPYLEMFARRQRLGWDTWGNEALNHVELPDVA